MGVVYMGGRILEKEGPEQGELSPAQFPGLGQNLRERGAGAAGKGAFSPGDCVRGATLL